MWMWKTGMKPLDSDSCNLLRAIAGQRIAGFETNIAQHAARIAHWDEAIEAAEDHGVLPLLHRTLISAEARIPHQAADKLRSKYERNAFQCFANASELLQVLKALQQASISAMPFKGVVLGACAYGDITARTAGDLDVMIARQDIPGATAILRERGYELKTASRPDGMPAEENEFEYHFERESDGMVIELRWRLELTSPRFKRDLGMDWVWPTRTSVELAGANVPSLDPNTLLLMLCMHGSKHAWSRLTWVCDISQMLESHPELNWKEVRKEAGRTGLERALALGVLLSHRMTRSRVPEEVL